MSPQKNIIFFGTPQLAQEIIQGISESKVYKIAAVVTSPDAPQGRGLTVLPTPVKQWALEQNIPIFTPEKLDEEMFSKLFEFEPDIFLVIAYGKIIPKKFIELPSLGTYNLHFSLLPKYRGAAPVQHALLNGDRTSGISIFALEEKLDTGPVFVQEKMELDEKNAAEVFSEMKDLSIPLLRKFCTELSTGKKFIPQKQDEKAATFAPKIQKEAGQIFPSKETSEEILCKYRAFFLWPQIFFVDEKTGLRIKLFGLKKTTETVILPEINSPFVHFKEKYFLSAADDLLEFEKAQPEGKKPLSGIEFWNFWKQRG